VPQLFFRRRKIFKSFYVEENKETATYFT